MALSKPTETVPIPRVLLPKNAAQRSQLSTRVIRKRWLWRSPRPKWCQTKRSELRIAGSNRSGQSHSGPTAKHKKHTPAPPYSAGLFNQGCSRSLRCAPASLHPLLLGDVTNSLVTAPSMQAHNRDESKDGQDAARWLWNTLHDVSTNRTTCARAVVPI